MREVSLPHANTYSRRQFISRGPPLILRENSRTHNFIEISRVFHGSVPGLARTFFYSAARKMAAARDTRSAGVTMKNPLRFIPFFHCFFYSSLALPLFSSSRITLALVYTLFYFNAHDHNLTGIYHCRTCFNRRRYVTVGFCSWQYLLLFMRTKSLSNVDIATIIVRVEHVKYSKLT